MHSIINVYLCSWTGEELRAVIVLLKRPEIKPAEIEDDLHKRIARAVHDKMIISFDMLEVEGVVREMMGDSCFRGHQHYKFRGGV